MKKYWAKWLVIGAGVAGCLWAVLSWRARVTPEAGPSALPQGETSVRLRLMPCKVGDGLYLIGNTFPAAVYVVDTQEGLAMIDSGLEAEYDKLAESLPALGLDLKRLKLILLTHAHGDHTMGAERLRRETGAKICIGREDAACLRDGGPWEAIFSKFDMPGVTLHTTTVDGELTDGQTLTLGEAHITAIATPGHTRGSFCYLVDHRDQRALFTGDTVMSLSDGLGTYSTYLPPKYRGDVEEYLASLRKLKDVPTPDLVLPGHPQADTIAQDPRLGKNRWETLLDRGITELEQLSERYARDGADFLDGTPRELTERLFYLGKMSQTSVYALMTSEGALLFDAAGDVDPPAFLARAWQTLDIDPPRIAALLLTSCREENLSGLEKLVTASDCRVVASSAGMVAVAANCPQAAMLTTDELAMLNVPKLEALATPGRDDTSVIYRFPLTDRLVLVSGDVLIECEETGVANVLESLIDQPCDTARFAESLAALERLQPNIWLSAHPLHGRNANLYDFEWVNTLSINRDLLRRYRRQKESTPAPEFQPEN